MIIGQSAKHTNAHTHTIACKPFRFGDSQVNDEQKYATVTNNLFKLNIGRIVWCSVSQYQSGNKLKWNWMGIQHIRSEEREKNLYENNIHATVYRKKEIKIHKLWGKHEFVMNSWQFFLLYRKRVSEQAQTSLTCLTLSISIWLLVRSTFGTFLFEKNFRSLFFSSFFLFLFLLT